MKRVLVLLVAGTALSGTAAVWAAANVQASEPGQKPVTSKDAVRR